MCLRVSSCCFCADLSTGAKAVAILGFLYGVAGIVTCAAAAIPAAYAVGAFWELVFSCLLYYGASARKPAFVVSWLVAAMIEIVSYGIAALTLAVLALLVAHHEEPQPQFASVPAVVPLDPEQESAAAKALVSGSLAIAAIAFMLVGLVYVYLWVVVHSFLRQLQRELGVTTADDGVKVELGYNVMKEEKQDPRLRFAK